MRIGVMSDSHGDRAAIRQAVLISGPVDLWLHAGDFAQDGHYLGQLTGRRTVVVAGNCDGRTDVGTDEIIEVAGKKIWLTHGHCFRVKSGLQFLIARANQLQVDIVVFGHTHRPDECWEENLLLFNPGSVALPNCGASTTCGILTIDEAGNVRTEIIDLARG